MPLKTSGRRPDIRLNSPSVVTMSQVAAQDDGGILVLARLDAEAFAAAQAHRRHIEIIPTGLPGADLGEDARAAAVFRFDQHGFRGVLHVLYTAIHFDALSHLSNHRAHREHRGGKHCSIEISMFSVIPTKSCNS